MSRRYECGTATKTEVGVLSGADAAEEEILTGDEITRGEHALIIGDPYASAFAVTGTPAELLGFVAKLFRQVTALVAEEPAPGGITYEGEVIFADGTHISLQCYEDRIAECPRELAGGYLCEGPCPDPA